MNKNNHFDLAALSWDTEENIMRNNIFAAAIKKHLKIPALNIMDFGCGTGLLSAHFLNSNTRLIGIETSSGMIESFFKRFDGHPNVSIMALNLELEPLPVKAHKYDLIVSAMAFHHLKDPKKVLSEFRRQLNSGGMIFIIDLDEEDGTFHPDNQGMGVHHFGFSRNTMENWSSGLGFDFFSHEIIHHMKKNDRHYGVGMGMFGVS